MLKTERLTELRKQKGMSRKAVASALQLDQSSYGNYELGKRQPSLEMLDRLSEFFHVTTDFLLGKSDIPNPETKPDWVAFDKEGKMIYDTPSEEMQELLRTIARLPEEAVEEAKVLIDLVSYKYSKEGDEKRTGGSH